MNPVALRRKLQGTWLMPGGDSAATTAALLPDGTMRMVVASRSGRERLRQAVAGDVVLGNWRVDAKLRPKAKGRLRSSASSLGSSFRPPVGSKADLEDDVRDGPFIVLNFTDLPKALGNVNIFGLRVDVANWLVSLDEVGGSYAFRVAEVSDDGERVEVEDSHGVRQTWDRLAQAPGTQPNPAGPPGGDPRMLEHRDA